MNANAWNNTELLTLLTQCKVNRLPPLNPPHFQMHSMCRLRSNHSRRPDLLIWICHLQLIAPSHSSKQALELRLRKPHPDTTPRAMQERKMRIIALRTTCVRCARLQPSSRQELLRFLAPEALAAVDCPGSEQHAGAFRYRLGPDICIARCLADRERDCRIET
jgi:hypothetical protein